MILSALRIANFKAFAASQRVPIRPITLIYGVNSAGKSSILHALALAHHAVETGELDVQRTRIGGEAIDLGGFHQYVHGHNCERQVELAFEIDPGELSGRLASLLRSARNITVEVAIGVRHADTEKTSSDDQDAPSAPTGPARVQRFAIDVDGKPLLAMSARPGGLLRLDRLDHGHPVFRELFRGLLMLGTTTRQIHEEDLAALGGVLDELVEEVSARIEGLFPRVEAKTEPGEWRYSWQGSFVAVSRERRREDLARAARLFLPRVLRDLIDGLGTAIQQEIRRLDYLGPLRSYPPRHLAFSQHHDPNWFAGGGHAWDVVRTREDIRRRVNAWLGDSKRLQTPYELEVRDLLPAPALAAELPPRLLKLLHDFMAVLLERSVSEYADELYVLAADLADEHGEINADDPNKLIPEIEAEVNAVADTEALAEHWTREMIRAGPQGLQDLVLIDKRSNTPVSHRDVGIGVSQVLPVLVSAFASREKLLAIEQPEIHLHPALQAELGDVFLQAALGEGKNRFLIETHSEHLLLRVMRRMRQTFDGDLPEGACEVRPEDVMVLFVEPDGSRSIIREMPLNERGELVKAWPGGFFEEGLREVF